MRPLRSLAVAVLAAGCAVVATGCSVVDALIWGSDGAEVIATTEAFIGDVASGEASGLLCEDFAAELGTAADWAGLAAGEPERFSVDYWEDRVALDPQWNINLEGLPAGIAGGETYPGDIFYRETDEGLCVIDVVWSTLIADG